MGEGVLAAERFVGRAGELQEVLDACRAAAGGHGSLTVISGEEGIGKTRLCKEVARRARHEGIAVIMGWCCGAGSPALWPWQPVLDELCGPDTFQLLAGEADLGSAERDRFARFAAVTEEIAAACERQPTCLVLDDIHAADGGTLLLLRFVVRSLHRLDLALVVTRRPTEPPPDSAEARLIDEIEREARLVALRGFGPDETAELLAANGLHADRDMVTMLRRVTDGHPLFLRRIAAAGPRTSADTLPAGVRPVIDHAVSQLAPDHQRILRLAAVLGNTPAVSEAAAVSQVDVVAVLDAVGAAAEAGLAVAESTSRFAFGHDLVRSTLVDGLSPADRLDAHGRAVAAIGEDPPVRALAGDLIRRAHHALAAAPRSADDAERAVDACRRAARSLVRSFAYEQADRLLTAAVEVHEPVLGPAPGRLLVEWAQAALLCGRVAEARRRFDRALAVAEHDRDPVLLAEALLGLGGYWLTESREPVERARLLGLQKATLEALPEHQVSLRCRLAARQAAEAFYNGGPIEPMDEALEAARRCGDPEALADALSVCHNALMHPEHAHTRLGLADELVRVAAEAGHGVLGLMGLCWRTLDLIDLADPRAGRALEDLRHRADALACQAILYEVGVIDVMLRIRSGRLREAEDMALACYEQGQDLGEIDAFAFYGAQLGMIRWLQGRTGELVDLLEGIASSPQLHEADFAFRASAAVFAYDAGDHDTARQVLRSLTADGLRTLPRSSTWLVGLMAITELAAALDDRDAARQAYELLYPFAELPIVPSFGVACFGSTHRALGTAARAFGDLERAVDHFEQAVAANQRIGNLPLTAMAEAQLGSTLLALGERDALDALGESAHHGRREEALGLLRGAIAKAEAMGMSARATAWRDELTAQPSTVARPRGPGRADRLARAGRTGSPVAPTRMYGSIRREGAGWSIAVDDRHVHVGRLVGVPYLAELVDNPGQAIPALSLAGHGRVDPGLSHQEILDQGARAAYVARVQDLTVELKEAEDHADAGRVGQLRAELDTLVEHLQSAMGLGGRPRSFAGPDERARTAVRKAIMRAIEAIDRADRGIGGLLRSSITTGRTCVYRPHPDQPITWSVDNRIGDPC